MSIKLLILVFLFVSLANPAQPDIGKVDRPKLERGTTFTINATGFQADTKFRLVTTRLASKCETENPDLGGTLASTPVVAAGTPTTAGTPGVGAAAGVAGYTVLVPDLIPIGNYTICLSETDATGAETWRPIRILSDSGGLVVTNDSKTPLKVTSVYKALNYQESEPNSGMYHLVVLGEGFSPVGQDNKLWFENGEVPICWNPSGKCADLTGVYGFGKVVSTQQLDFFVPGADSYQGARKVEIHVGDKSSTPALKTTFARISRYTPTWVAVAVLVGLVLLVGVLLGTTKSGHQIAEQKASLLSSLFLDKSTDTYSLSKAQFYAWTAAAAFGYTYLTIARSLLQGFFEFAPIPDNLPGILLVSAGTATMAVAVNNSKPKGAGSVQPSLADFITTGGLVAPERVQFLVWTVLGVLTFLFLIIMSDPGAIETLPAIPQKFLYLMGISSSGYLAGRLARKAGPVIDSILAKPGSITLEIHGRNLSKDAGFQIDGEDVALDIIAEGPNTDHRPEIVAKDDQTQEPGLAKVLKLTIDAPKPNWLTRKSNPADDKKTHILSIFNPDAQKADWPFSIPGPTAIISVTGAGQTATVGSALNMQIAANQAAQVDLDASPSVAGDGAITTYQWFGDDNKSLGTTAKISRQPALGTHVITLRVTDAGGLSDSATVTVVREAPAEPPAH